MRKLANFKLDRYSYSSWVVLHVNKRAINTLCGLKDDIYVYHDKEFYYIYCELPRMPYAGVEVIRKDNGERVFDHFIQGGQDDLVWLIESKQIPRKINFLTQSWF